MGARVTVRLLVVSSAATTTFCAEKLEGPPGSGHWLWLDGNQKITAGNGTYEAPRPNAFSLVQIEDCPQSTPTCRAACYVAGIELHAKSTHDLYRHNSRTLREIFAAPDGAGGLLADQPAGRWWARRLGVWIEEHARGGFRWHVSGDLFDPSYAWWVARVVEASPGVRHWIYTRSHNMSAAFVGVPNITVNYSVDADNYVAAQRYVAAHAAIGEPVRQCYMVTGDGAVPTDLPADSVLFPDYALRGVRGAWFQALPSHQKKMVCPTDLSSKSERRRCGPCDRCIRPVGISAREARAADYLRRAPRSDDEVQP